ncbi:chalcone isomerase [Desulfonema ishimotonii]|uniref:Chalcone isomerase n=1 Tax=Desulfonema ishimotonii TaxID=45657 RepID=A0A401FTT3_9BACT|nr:chalcone isomerase family protein [Desulfonema ishimotonii]GBC60370.1 chalcone isomerase [Desulfonema ishimotonii]
MIRRLSVIILVILMGAPLGFAREIGGVDLPESLIAGKETLMLNGAGLRKKLFIKVYACGLYLKQKSREAPHIVSANEPMAIRMKFIYDGVSNEKLIDAWNEGFENGTSGNIAPIQAQVDEFNSFFVREAKKGDVYDIIYTPEAGVRVYIKDKLMGSIQGVEFKKALFAIWLGEKPADTSLRDGMLDK